MRHLSDVNGEIILKRLDTDLIVENASTDKVSKDDKLILLLDIETTGLNPEKDEIIQISILPFFVNDAYSITGYKKPIIKFQEIDKNLPDNIVNLTNITDDMLKGNSIPWEAILKLFNSADAIMAYNSEFDLKFIKFTLEKLKLEIPKVNFCCAMKDIDWNELFPSKTPSLELLCHYHGFWLNGRHNALNDVLCLFQIFVLYDLQSKSKLKECLEKSRKNQWKLYVINTQFVDSFFLKSRKFKWDNSLKIWYSAFDSYEKLNEEKSILQNSNELNPNISFNEIEIPSNLKLTFLS
jgi:DNA polymerase-3 subunit epsilon